jgi:nucleotide-binding universal stress UspA family protein
VVAARALAQHRTTPAAIVRAAAVPFLAFVLALGIVVRAVTSNGLATALGHLIPGGTGLPALLGIAALAAVLANVINNLPAASAGQLLAAAAERLGRPCTRAERAGRAEREVGSAAEGADLLVLARDGDRTHLGPRSLGPASRFIVDHAPCHVLLVWPELAPSVATIPPPAPYPPHRR